VAARTPAESESTIRFKGEKGTGELYTPSRYLKCADDRRKRGERLKGITL